MCIAPMVKLADTRDLGSRALCVGVQLPLGAPSLCQHDTLGDDWHGSIDEGKQTSSTQGERS
jgi:hypothetical protein